ncbi:hypothetical protein [Moheibacter lacus]|nr:hypothetical protein [Moheibacter lacus]
MSNTSNWIKIAQGLYLVILLLVSLRIIWDTRSISKTMGYL